jgi:hypothetical protein
MTKNHMIMSLLGSGLFFATAGCEKKSPAEKAVDDVGDAVEEAVDEAGDAVRKAD